MKPPALTAQMYSPPTEQKQRIRAFKKLSRNLSFPLCCGVKSCSIIFTQMSETNQFNVHSKNSDRFPDRDNVPRVSLLTPILFWVKKVCNQQLKRCPRSLAQCSRGISPARSSICVTEQLSTFQAKGSSSGSRRRQRSG